MKRGTLGGPRAGMGRKHGLLTGAAALFVLLAATGFPALSEATFPSQSGRIAFSANRDGDFEIFTIDPAVGEPSLAQLTHNAAGDERPVYAPGGAKIVFSSTRSGNNDIWSMNPDGTNPTQLTTAASNDTRPTFSPFGNRILFTSNRGGDDEIWAMNVDGSSQTQLTNAAGTSANADYAPNGSRIAFASSRDGDQEIFTMNPDGSDPVQLTADPTEDSLPSYSPDGTKIAFNSKRSDPDADLWVMNSDGSAQTQLTTHPAEDAAPVYSPDGTQIVFHTRREDAAHEELYVMPAGGGAQTALTVTASPILNIFPDWQSLSPPIPVPTPPATETPPTTPPEETPLPADPPKDTEAPGLTLGGKKKQKLDEAIEVKATCSEDCTATGDGTLNVKTSNRSGQAVRKAFNLKPATAQVTAGATAVLKLGLSRKARKAATKALENGGKVGSRTNIAATDTTGNGSSATQAVKLKPA